MTDPLDMCRKLIARAGHASTPQEEARTSGVIAAQLICEHGFQIMAKNHIPARVPANGFAWSAPPVRAPRRATMNRPAKISVKHGGFCAWCHVYIPAGEVAWWKKGSGMAHDEEPCRTEAFL